MFSAPKQQGSFLKVTNGNPLEGKMSFKKTTKKHVTFLDFCSIPGDAFRSLDSYWRFPDEYWLTDPHLPPLTLQHHNTTTKTLPDTSIFTFSTLHPPSTCRAQLTIHLNFIQHARKRIVQNLIKKKESKTPQGMRRYILLDKVEGGCSETQLHQPTQRKSARVTTTQ